MKGANVKHVKLGRPSILAAVGFVMIGAMTAGGDAFAQSRSNRPGGPPGAGKACVFDQCWNHCLQMGGVGGSAGTPGGNCAKMCSARCTGQPEHTEGRF
jgi:hypothetical protein